MSISTEDGDGIAVGFSSEHTEGANFLFLDGSVRLLNRSINNQNAAPYGVFQHLSTIAGGETD